MNRLFKRSNYAKYVLLDKMWDFVLDPDERGKGEKWYEHFPTNAEKIPVPSCWNMELDKFPYTGTAWYKTDFVTESDSIYLKFEAVGNECDVYVDGKYIGYHYGPFVEFGFLVEEIGTGTHELVVRVNNTVDNVHTVPHYGTDWFNYGGINRSVEVREIGDIRIADYRMDYDLDVQARRAVLNIRADICTKTAVSEELEVYVNDTLMYTSTETVDGKASLAAKGIVLENVELWDIYEPNLYYIRIKFGNEDIIDRTGFREIKTAGKDILLNGKKIIIAGINRHEEHPDWGFAEPFNLIKRDIDIIRGMNCNAVRGAHYPNSKKTLDYLDEVGLLFWEEIPLWGSYMPQHQKMFENELFTARVLSMHGEMVKRDLHHPCIIFWGLHNEIPTETQLVYDLSKKIIEVIKQLDTTRLITFASNRNIRNQPADICMDLVDVVSYNYYTGWYEKFGEETFAEFIMRMRAQLESTGNGNKPLIMSEFGAGAVKGVTSLEAQRWSENYQAASLDEAIRQYMSTGEVAGLYVWQFCDIRCCESRTLVRPRLYNNKGVLNEYRQPKFAYETVKKAYRNINPKSDNETKVNLF